MAASLCRRYWLARCRLAVVESIPIFGLLYSLHMADDNSDGGGVLHTAVHMFLVVSIEKHKYVFNCCRTGRSHISGTILQATSVATGASVTTIVGVNLGVGLTVSGTSQTFIYSTNGALCAGN